MSATAAQAHAPQRPGSDDVAVSIHGLTVFRGRVKALENVSASIPRGRCTAVIGPNGAGKTSFILSILGEVPYSGTVDMRGATATPGTTGMPNTTGTIKSARPRGTPRPAIGYVPQKLQLDRGMPLTVTEFMALGLQRRPLWLGVARAVRQRIAQLLETVSAGHLAQRRLGALSGGETQRVLLALALAQKPELLILDEAAAGVDPQGEHVFCHLLDELRLRYGFTQLMVSHDLHMVAHHADHIICLNKSLLAEGTPSRVLTPENLLRLYGLQLHGPLDNTVCAAAPRTGTQQPDTTAQPAPDVTAPDVTGPDATGTTHSSTTAANGASRA